MRDMSYCLVMVFLVKNSINDAVITVSYIVTDGMMVMVHHRSRMQVVLYHLLIKVYYLHLHLKLQLSHRHLMGVISSQLTQLSILHLDFIHRSIEQLQQGIMSQ